MKCLNCGKEFEAKRKTARYCSSKCRKLAFQRKPEQNAKVTLKNANIVSVPDRDGSVTRVTHNVTETKSVTITPEGEVDNDNLPANYGQEDCECKHCQQHRNMGGKLIINHGAYKTELKHNEFNRVSLPGDVDYDGACPVAVALVAGEDIG